MAKNRRKSAAVALAVLGVAGLSLASASTLSLTGGTLQAGVTDLTNCQPAATKVVVGFGTPALGSNGIYNVADVKLSNVDAACAGKAVKITLLSGTAPSYTQVGTEITGTLDATGAFSKTLGGSVAASSVSGAAVVFSN